jgi:hypothetical protein
MDYTQLLAFLQPGKIQPLPAPLQPLVTGLPPKPMGALGVLKGRKAPLAQPAPAPEDYLHGVRG